MDTWEYLTLKMQTTGFLGGKFEEDDLNVDLNRYGSEGWELVSALTTNKSYGETRDIVCIFKRKKHSI